MLNRFGYVSGGALRAAQPFPAALKGVRGAVLRDGTIVFAGGVTSGGANVSTIFRYYPDTQVFITEAATLLSARSEHVAVSCPLDGSVLIAGGRRGVQDYSAQTEVIEVSPTGAITVSAGGAMLAGRNLAAAHALPSGRVLVALGIGAGDAYLTNSEIYDPRTRTFSASAGIPPAARAATTFGQAGTSLHLNGGRDAASVVQSGPQYAYAPATDSWSSRANMIQPRAFHAVVSPMDGTVVSIGGVQAVGPDVFAGLGEVYYPTLDASRADQALVLSVRDVWGAGGLIVGGTDAGGQVIQMCWNYVERVHTGTPWAENVVVGGRNNVGAGLASSYKFNSLTESFIATGSMSAARESAAGATFSWPSSTPGRSRSLIAGGIRGGAPTADAEIFDPETDGFLTLGVTIGTARHSSAAITAQSGSVLHDRRVWVTGGKDAGGTSLNLVHRFDPATQTFAVATALPVPLALHGSGSIFDGISNRAIIGGGVDSAGLLRDEIYMFNPTAGSFSLTPGGALLRYPKSRMACASNGRSTVVFAGGTKLLNNDPLNEIDVYAWNAQAQTGARTAFANNLVTPRRDAVALTLTADEILIVGGYGVSAPVSVPLSVEKINLRTGVVIQVGIAPADVRYSAVATGMLNSAAGRVSLVPASFFTVRDDGSTSRSGAFSSRIERSESQTYDIQVEEGETIQVVLWARTNTAYGDRTSSLTAPELLLQGCGLNVRQVATDLTDTTWTQKGGVALSGTATASGVVVLTVSNRSAAYGARLFIDDVVLA